MAPDIEGVVLETASQKAWVTEWGLLEPESRWASVSVWTPVRSREVPECNTSDHSHSKHKRHLDLR